MAKSNKPHPGCWAIFEATIGLCRRILLFGLPGTGKTYQATRSGLRPDQPVYAVTLTEETSAAELRGHWVPRGQEFVWHDGPVVRAWRQGARLVLNEIDHAGDDVWSLLHVILDDSDTARLTLPTGETIEPHPDFSAVATMNGEVEMLPEALQDRFTVTVDIDQTHPAALASLPRDLRKVAEATAVLPAGRRASVRTWQAFAELREIVGEKMAAFAVFGKRAPDVLDALKIRS